jgi:hypothetical protein
VVSAIWWLFQVLANPEREVSTGLDDSKTILEKNLAKNRTVRKKNNEIPLARLEIHVILDKRQLTKKLELSSCRSIPSRHFRVTAKRTGLTKE